MSDLKEQYRTSANLDVRIQLHERFSTNPYDFMLWIFDQLDLPPSCRIFEAGCGTGKLWKINLHRLPPGWDITMSDFSTGMAQGTRKHLTGTNFRFVVCDVQHPPVSDGLFDAVIANHMLYHVPDLPGALAAIRRLLKPGGRLYATSNGKTHLHEIDDLMPAFIPHKPIGEVISGFTLENGTASLQNHFSDVQLIRYPDSLEVTEAEPLAAFCLSRSSVFTHRAQINDSERLAFVNQIEARRKQQGGAIHITKDGGLFIATA